MNGVVVARLGRLRDRITAAIGAHGWAGLALLIASAAVSVWMIPVERSRLEQAERTLNEHRRVAQEKERTRVADLNTVHPPEDGLLAAAEDFEPTLRELTRLAALVRLEPAQGRYLRVDATDAAPEMIRIEFEMKSTYPVLRLFVTMALNSLPALVLQDFALRRGRPDDALIDARIRFALLLRRHKENA